MSKSPRVISIQLSELSQRLQQFELPVSADNICEVASRLSALSMQTQHFIHTEGAARSAFRHEVEVETIARLSSALEREDEVRTALPSSGDGVFAKVAVESLKLAVNSLESTVRDLAMGEAK